MYLFVNKWQQEITYKNNLVIRPGHNNIRKLIIPSFSLISRSVYDDIFKSYLDQYRKHLLQINVIHRQNPSMYAPLINRFVCYLCQGFFLFGNIHLSVS